MPKTNEQEKGADSEAQVEKHGYKVGDSLAFNVGYGAGKWDIHQISKITPSGRMTCGPYTLNPNLRIRGRSSGFGGAPSACVVTERIKREHIRQRNLDCITHTTFSKLADEKIIEIVRIVKSL